MNKNRISVQTLKTFMPLIEVTLRHSLLPGHSGVMMADKNVFALRTIGYSSISHFFFYNFEFSVTLKLKIIYKSNIYR